MRVLIVNTDYSEFLQWLHAEHRGLADASYEQQSAARMGTLFGVADFYSAAFRRLGHAAMDVHANNHALQAAWAREHGLEVGPPPTRAWAGQPSGMLRYVPKRVRALARRTPLYPTLSRNAARPSLGPWHHSVLAAQIEHFRPDVLLNQSVAEVRPGFLGEMHSHIGLVVAQHPALPLDGVDLIGYDLLVSSFPPTVEAGRSRGLPAELWRLAFEPGVLACLPPGPKDVPLSFVGNLSAVHGSRLEFLEAVHSRLSQLKIWGPGIDQVPASSTLRSAYVGPAWGLEMYRVLAASRITLNHHGDVAPFANNLRLYEATGVGTLLLTDWKANLAEILEPGKEVVAYRSIGEAIEQIDHYLCVERERDAIARAGQERTLGEHTYDRRANEFVELVGRHLP